jgi:outer membrane protein OmpU
MNNIKKIGLTALAASLVSVSANAGSVTVAGGASINAAGYSGELLHAGSGFSMGNQLTFSGSGELDNGLNVSISFVLDQGDDETDVSGASAPFDSHSVKISSDALGTLTFNGEGGTTAANMIDKSAAGDIWDKFDGLTNADAQAVTSTAGNNSFYYSSPELMAGLTVQGSYQPQGSNRVSGTGYGVQYTGVEGLTLKYAVSDIVGTTATASGDETVLYASYAMGSFTVSYSDMESDIGTSNGDYTQDAVALSYTVSDELSVTYGMESSALEGTTTEADYTGLSASYTAGGMTITAGMWDAENASYTTASNEDFEKWTLGASFAF